MHGTALKQFASGLDDLFIVQIGRQSIDNLDESSVPFIAFWPQQSHFVIVWAMDDETVLFGDPASGMKTMLITTFLQYWDGVTIVLRPRMQSNERGVFSEKPNPWMIIRNIHPQITQVGIAKWRKPAII